MPRNKPTDESDPRHSGTSKALPPEIFFCCDQHIFQIAPAEVIL